MRIDAVVAAAVMPAVFFGVASKQTVHVQAQNIKKPVAKVVAAPKKPEPKYVTVQSGDYLAKIAEQNQTTYPRLYDANTQVSDPDLIYPGEQIRIPLVDEQLTHRSLPGAQAQAATPAQVSQPVAQPVVAAPQPQQTSTPTYTGDTSIWDKLAQCESGGNWSINTGNGFYGGLQFTLSSWQAVGGSGYPNQASKDEQIARAQMLQARQGWGAWPVCSVKAGLR